MSVTSFDHVAMPTANPEELIRFYDALGFQVPDINSIKTSAIPAFEIRFGTQKINVHLPELWKNTQFTLRGPSATPGCADLCFVWGGTENDLRRRLAACGAEIIIGPVKMKGAQGASASIYTRDPDQNLIEFMFYDLSNLSSEIIDRIPL